LDADGRRRRFGAPCEQGEQQHVRGECLYFHFLKFNAQESIVLTTMCLYFYFVKFNGRESRDESAVPHFYDVTNDLHSVGS
jgi:hypothetical protein